MNKRQRIAQIIVNVLIIAELSLSILLASKDPEVFTIRFFKYFFMMLIPTFILGIVVIRKLGTKGTPLEIRAGISEKERISRERAQRAAAAAGQKKTYPVNPEMLKMLTGRDSETARVSKWRAVLQKTSSIFLLIVVICLIDSCQAKFRQPINILHLLPGETETVSGILNRHVKDVNELKHKSNSNLITLSITSTYSGFWFGTPGWNGQLTVNPDIAPGLYTLTVAPEENTPKDEQFVLYVAVHPDAASLRKTFTSLIMRFSGVHPWKIVAFMLPLTILTFGAVFLLSRKIESLMANSGSAEVFWMRVADEGYEIAFGLGTKHGIRPGDRLSLFNDKSEKVGTVEVRKVSKSNSVAMAGFDSEVRTGYMVSVNNI